MAITLTYTSSRQEVTEWYWRMWHKNLWIHHTFFFIVIFGYALASDGHWPPNFSTIIYGFLAAAAVIGFFIAFPQLAFKPQVRTLTVSEDGIQTNIGNKSGSVKWNEIRSIEDTNDLKIMVRRNQNAFLIPQRAFQSEKKRCTFLEAIQTWQSKSASNVSASRQLLGVESVWPFLLC